MKITKYGHCCLLIEDGDTRILVDPGILSDTKKNDLTNLDAVVITHEHDDHFDIDSLEKIFAINPGAVLITNTAIKNLLSGRNFNLKIVEGGAKILIKNINIEGFGEFHRAIYPSIEPCRCIGYMFSDKLFYPADNFTNPGRSVDILALPVSGPWLKVSESIDYALKLKPRIAFPVHDGNLKTIGGEYGAPEKVLNPAGIEFLPLEICKEYDL